jgi:hypothetical protein
MNYMRWRAILSMQAFGLLFLTSCVLQPQTHPLNTAPIPTSARFLSSAQPPGRRHHNERDWQLGLIIVSDGGSDAAGPHPAQTQVLPSFSEPTFYQAQTAPQSALL